MIILEVIESPDIDCLGKWDFQKNRITVGNGESKLSHLKILDPYLKVNHFDLHAKKNFLYLHNNYHQDELYIYINGKKTLQGEVLFPGDIISFGGTRIKVIKFDFIPVKMGQEMSNNLKKIFRGNHPAANVIELIEKEIAK